MDENLRRTPLYEAHRELGARLVPFAGYEMPVQYEGIVKEHEAVRERVGLFDVSHMGELFLSGTEAIRVADHLVTNAVWKLEVGQAMYTACCNPSGHILDDLIVYRIGEAKVLVVCNASNRAKISAHFAEHAKGKCEFEDRSDELCLLALQGPKAAAVMRELGGELADLSFFRTAEGEVASIPCRVARTGYTGEDGFEIFVANDRALELWKAIMTAGAAHGIAPIGLGARDTLRLESKLSLYGNDIDETTHPYEAGLGWVVKLDHDFVGRDALKAIKEDGYERRLVGFEMTGRGIARHGFDIVHEGQTVGIVTSGSPSPTLGKNIGLGYVPQSLAKVGSTFQIDIRGKKKVDAQVVKTPFYKRKQE